MRDVFGLVGQWIVVVGFLVGLYLVVKNPDAVSKITDSATRLNYTGIMALKAG
jgi:hypothetical protein